MRDREFKIRVTAPGGMSIVIVIRAFSLASALIAAKERVYDTLSNAGFSLPDDYKVQAALMVGGSLSHIV
jgi:hypothetical protein